MPEAKLAGVAVRPLEEADLGLANQIFNVAFGTFLGLPDPEHTFGDSDLLRTRFRADGSGALAAEVDGVLVGSNIVTGWGSVGFFGPLTVDPRFLTAVMSAPVEVRASPSGATHLSELGDADFSAAHAPVLPGGRRLRR